MRTLRRTFVITCLAIVAILIWAGIYARKQGFTNSWREAVEIELESHGYFIDIGKLTLGAFRGLVAEDVKLFRDAEKTEQFAEISDIFLDVGLDQVWEKKITINTLDIQDGRLYIPLDPENPSARQSLRISNIIGRIAFTDSFVEIVRFEGNMAGIELFMKGKLARSTRREKRTTDTSKDALNAMVVKIQSLKRIIDRLESFEFPAGNPTLRIEFHGDVRDLSSTTAKAVLTTPGQDREPAFRKKGSSYDLLSLDFEAELDGRIKQIKVPRFRLVDRQGSLDITGNWNEADNRFHFDLTSTGDLINMLEFFFPDQKWGEVVLFHPPEVKAEGYFDFNLLKTEKQGFFFPGQILGNFQTQNFVTSGVVYFDGSSGDFSMEGNRFYVRNFRVGHKTGFAMLNCKYEPGKNLDSLQFQSAVKMDPRVFSPFFKDEETKRFLSKWNFSDYSGVYLEVSGRASSIQLDDLQAKGDIHLQDFQLNQVNFEALETDFEIDGDKRWYRNVRLSRGDDEIMATMAHVDTDSRIWEIKGGISTLGLGDAIGAFSPILKEALKPYRFDNPPTVHFQGKVDSREAAELAGTPRKTDLHVSFSNRGTAHYRIFGRDIPLDSPKGILHLKENKAHLHSVSAGLLGGTLALEFDTPDYLKKDPPFGASIVAEGIDTRKLVEILGYKNQAQGTINGEIHISGKTTGIASVNGHGEATISNGDLLQLPPLKSLKPLLEENENQFSNENTFSGRASTKFEINKGIVTTTSLNLVPGRVPMRGAAKIDLPAARIEMKLAPTATDSPRVYEAKGDCSKPDWNATKGNGTTTLSGR